VEPTPSRAKSDVGGSSIESWVTLTPGITTWNYADTLTVNRLYYEPFQLKVTTTIKKLAMQIQTAGAAGTHIRLGIYNADTSWQPTSLVIDAGTVTADIGGVKVITLSPNITLTPGNYLSCFVSDGTPVMYEVETPSPFTYSNLFYGCQDVYDAFTYDVLPSTGQTWSTYEGYYNSHRRIVFGIVL
jgi:hypothetical protein